MSLDLILSVPASINPDGVGVRTAGDQDNPLFCLPDICRALGNANHRDVASRLDDDEKCGVGIPDAIGRTQETLFVTEAGLFHVVLTSRADKATPFRRWVTHEVLPQIRKTGRYAPGEDHIIAALTSIIEVRKGQLELEAKHRELELKAERAEQLAVAAMGTAEGNYGCYSVLAWLNIKGMSATHSEASQHGKRLARICRETGREIRKIRDPRFGEVNLYPETVLDAYFKGVDN